MLNTDLHRTILIKILKAVYTNKDLRNILGFKGGTAAFLFYDLPRFSVDLDFDLLDSSKENLVYEKLAIILPKFGNIEPAMKKNTIFFLVDYGKGERKIKVEISRRPSPAKFEVKSYLGLSVLVMEKSCMLSSKLAALLARKRFASRDLFDLWFFLDKGWSFDKQCVKSALEYSLEKALKEALNKVEQVKNNQLLHGLGELINNSQKDWVKRNLKEELIFLLKLKLDSLSKI